MKQIILRVLRAELLTNKARLPEFNLLGTLTRGLHRIWHKMCILCSTLEWIVLQKVQYNQVAISNLDVESWNSKSNLKVIIGTGGLPKALKGYGNRGVVVPGTGRAPAKGFCYYSSTADSVSIVSTNSLKKIQKINELCIKNKDFVVKDKLFNLLYDKEMYYAAYLKLRSKPVNMTPGINPTTLDGISEYEILKIINSLKDGTFQFSPGKRVYIPKAKGGERPLTLALPRDQMVQECIRMILEAIFEPNFHPSSHGFRPNRSCHTALKELRQKLGMAKWFIVVDISKCFDTINHDRLMKILEVRINDKRFLDLIRKALKAGYLEFSKSSHSVAGTSQGSIVSPILANIYLNKLDWYLEWLKSEYNIGTKATINPVYNRISSKKERAESTIEKKKLHKLLIETPSKLFIDPKFKKLEFVRYADDCIIGVRGSLEDCRFLQEKIEKYIRGEILTLSKENIEIRNANKEIAKFLSVNIGRKTHRTFRNNSGIIRRNVNNLLLTAPILTITKKLATNGFFKENTPYPKFLWMGEEKDAIILLYNSVYRGIINYYRFSDNFNQLSSKIHYVLKNSCARLLAAKYKSSLTKIYARFGKDLKGKDKHAFIGITLGIRTNAFSVKTQDVVLRFNAQGIRLANLEALVCSICESEYRVEMHRIRMMKHLDPEKSQIDRLMIKRRRKQIPLCRECLMSYHKERNTKEK